MSNTILTNQLITLKAMEVLVNNLSHTKRVNRQYESRFAMPGNKTGATLNVRIPPRTVGRQSNNLSIESQVETYAQITIGDPWGVDMSFLTTDLTLSIDDFSNRYIKPAAATIANRIDRAGLALYTSVYNVVGTPGTPNTTLSNYSLARALLNNEAAPPEDRSLIMDPNSEASIVNGLTTLFNPNKAIGEQYMTGSMGRALGMDWFMDQNVYAHTIGTYGGTPLVNGSTAQGATTLVTDGWTPTTTSLNVGDVFTVAGVYAINPQNRQSTTRLRNFVVTQVTTTDGGGNSTISFSPAMIAPVAGVAQYNQTVTALPADNAAITVFGASGAVSYQSLMYHKDAFTFACVKLDGLDSLDTTYSKSNDLGLSMRMTKAGNINTNTNVLRLDVLGGWACLRPELCVRVCS